MSFRHPTLEDLHPMSGATDDDLLRAIDTIRYDHEWDSHSIEARAARGEALAFIVAERLQRLLNKLEEEE